MSRDEDQAISLIDRIRVKAEKALIPIGVHFDLTYRCNLRCIHCYLPEKDRYPSVIYKKELKRQNREELTTEEIFGILDQLAEYGTLFINFSGGEIFARGDVLDIIEYARKRRFSVSLMTTGTIRFDESVADRLADVGIQQIDISIYSDEPEIHDSITRVPGSFSKAVKAIEILRERGVNVKVKCPLMKTNIESFKGVIDLAESYKAHWMFDPNITVGKEGDREPVYLRISDDELKEFLTFIMGTPKSRMEKDTQKGPVTATEEFLDEHPCGACHSSCYISPYGDVQSCIEISMIGGSLREEPFKEIWENSEEMLRVRAIKRRDLMKCQDCPDPDYCHRCIGVAYAEHGDLLAPSEQFCRIVKMRDQIEREVTEYGKEEDL